MSPQQMISKKQDQKSKAVSHEEVIGHRVGGACNALGNKQGPRDLHFPTERAVTFLLSLRVGLTAGLQGTKWPPSTHPTWK